MGVPSDPVMEVQGQHHSGHHPHHPHHAHHGHHWRSQQPHKELTPEEMEQMRQFNFMMQCFSLLFLFAVVLYAIVERRRRRRIAAENGGFPTRSGDLVSSLFECLCMPSLCVQATFFGPVLAAFNRAEVENRDCSACDGLFALKTPITQYHTRQSIRSANSLETAEFYDAFGAVCCTPCAVAQDTLELERRTALNALPAQQMATVTALPVGTAVPMQAIPAPPEYEKLPAQFQC